MGSNEKQTTVHSDIQTQGPNKLVTPLTKHGKSKRFAPLSICVSSHVVFLLGPVYLLI